ncbi:MAG: aminotransferase class I/II-fold pyridoxal phosphate-dependent enzyme [Corallococcus sp.]|nr:aminotransferase class I/II-fold pyridoxal phosphate-dependent enzyme [Corallococcus sp.]
MLKLPINDMLKKYASSSAVRLHMPGHKGTVNAEDITELSFTDDLRCPDGVILQSEKQYADIADAKYCHYVVNGSTGGLFAMAMCSKGKVLAESNRHVSLSNALDILHKTVVTVENRAENGKYLPLTLQQIADAVEADGEIGTVFVTSPDYFGRTADLKSIYKYLKQRGILLFVDSAHGAHFGFSKLLPPNAAKYCDAAVESVHKTLGGMTQTAVLLTNDKSLSYLLKDSLNKVTTTSPSFVLAASIESAIVYAHMHAKEAYERLYKDIERFKRQCQISGWKVAYTDDFTRLVIDCGARGINGKSLLGELEKRGIFCEFATERYLVAIITLYDSGVSVDAFATALQNVNAANSVSDFDYVERCFGKEVI